MNNKKNNFSVKLLSIGSIFVGLAVMFQVAPVLIPVIGMAVSPLSTLPIALAGIINIYLGITVYIASVLLLSFISVEEALILIFTTGILGLIMGILIYRKGRLISVLCSGIALSIGISIMSFIIGIFQIDSLKKSIPIGIIVLIFVLFSLIYAWLWDVIIRKFTAYLIKIKLFDDSLQR